MVLFEWNILWEFQSHYFVGRYVLSPCVERAVAGDKQILLPAGRRPQSYQYDEPRQVQ